MKLITPSYEIWEQQSYDKKGIYQQIERAGRTCYKSEDKITDDSCWDFVQRLIDSKHYAMLEHGTVYLHFTSTDYESPKLIDSRPYHKWEKYTCNKYSKVHFSNGSHTYVTTNLRVLVENNWELDLNFLCEPTEWHEKRITVHFTCNRQVSHEFVRHRVFSFAQESTRYCNYTKDKFGNELVFIDPLWCDYIKEYLDESGGSYLTRNIYKPKDTASLIFKEELERIEETYFNLIANGWKPQQAANILPNAIKTELVMTGFVDDWKHFFDLRALGTTGAPHPQAKELAQPLYEDFVEKHLLN